MCSITSAYNQCPKDSACDHVVLDKGECVMEVVSRSVKALLLFFVVWMIFTGSYEQPCSAMQPHDMEGRCHLYT